MPDPHWENLKEIFHAAAALPLNARAAYLDKACDDNPSLRAAVESLLKSHEETSFVDTPAYQAAAEMLAGNREFNPGQTIANYQIRSVLPASFAADPNRLRLFERETQAAGGLQGHG